VQDWHTLRPYNDILIGNSMAYQMVATALTLNDLEGHSALADVFKCYQSNMFPLQ